VATRKRILDMLASDKLFAASFHMPFPAIGYIDKGPSGYRWVPHSYQLKSVVRGTTLSARLKVAGVSFFGFGCLRRNGRFGLRRLRCFVIEYDVTAKLVIVQQAGHAPSPGHRP